MKSISAKRLTIGLLVCVVILAQSAAVSAQQETGSVVPETRNPQNNPVELHQQQGELQDTSPQQLLTTQDGSIRIPAGRPAPAPVVSSADEKNLWESYWYIIILGLLPAIFYAISLKPDRSSPAPETIASTPPVVNGNRPKQKMKKQSGKKKQPRSKRHK